MSRHLLNNVQTPASDGRVTNGGKGVSYLRDYYMPTMLADQMAEEHVPVAGS
jgi:hypothetical protein